VHKQHFELTINGVLQIGEITVTVVDVDDEDVCFRIEGIDDYEQLEIQPQQFAQVLKSAR